MTWFREMWFRKTRSVLIAVGLAVLIGCLIGARELTHGGSNATATPIDAGPRSNGGPVVLGLVDTDPQLVNYGLPPVLQSGVVTKVHVKDGDEVKAGQALYQFDDTIPQAEVKKAQATVAYAETKVKEAEELAKQHAENVKGADKEVEAADRKVDLTRKYYELVDRNLENGYMVAGKDPKTWTDLKLANPDLYKANVDYDTATQEKNLKVFHRDRLKAADPQVKVREAQAAVVQARAGKAMADDVVNLCVVRAKMPGTIEQITIGPGTTMGVGTRTPALWLIPAGPRVVRAEVEAEFAHRVGKDIEGKTVTIADHTDPKLTYTGVVRRIPPVFMLKRGNTENFLGGDTRVLEAVIDVSDPTPAGKPPLRVGQRVRVNLGQ